MRKNNEEKAKRTGNEDNIAITYVASDHKDTSTEHVSFDEGDEETDLLDEKGEPYPLEEETDILVDENLTSHDEDETELLVDEDNEETDLLDESSETETLCLDENNADDKRLRIVDDILIVHTDEVIE